MIWWEGAARCQPAGQRRYLSQYSEFQLEACRDFASGYCMTWLCSLCTSFRVSVALPERCGLSLLIQEKKYIGSVYDSCTLSFLVSVAPVHLELRFIFASPDSGSTVSFNALTSWPCPDTTFPSVQQHSNISFLYSPCLSPLFRKAININNINQCI
jgi:hypothetical protein